MVENGNSGFYMPVAPAYANNGGGFGGGFGGDWGWIILLLLLCGGGMWGMGGGMMGMDFGLYPWLNNSQNINDGFRDQMLNTSVSSIQNSITSGFGDVQTALCGGFAGVNASINGAQSALTQQMYSNQIADLERSFAAQTANTAGLTNLSSQLANCCCENRAATNDVKYTIATEASTTRAANSANTQAILDKLCQLELDGVKAQVDAKNDRIAELTSQLNMATIRESQTAQNAFIAQGLNNEVDALYNRLANCPVPSTPVYGRTPIFTCNQNNGCGCGGNSFYN
jgi:hypothetical protein